MKDINLLRKQKSDLISIARKFDDECTKDGRAMTADEQTKYDKMVADIKSEEANIKREEELQKMELEAAGRQTSAIPVAVVDDLKGGFRTFGEFLRAIKFNPEDSRLVALRTGVNEGVDSAGGFTVPEEFKNQILMRAIEESVLRRAGATIIPMASDTINIPKIKDTSHASNVYGGVVAYWTEETGTITGTQPTFGQVKLIAKKLAGYTYASNELLADNAVGLEQLLIKIFGGAVSYFEDTAFISGDGVGKPLGILSSGALLAVNRSAASTVAAADLASMASRIYPESLGRAVWLANPTVMKQLIALGSTYLTWLNSGIGGLGLQQPIPTILLGRPIIFTEKCKALGTAGDIILVDPSYYLIGERTSLAIATSEHVRFTTDETAWRFVERVDGQPWVDNKFTPANGSTLSPFVTLHSTTNGGD